MSATAGTYFRFLPSDDGIVSGVKRIALGEVETALSELHDPALTDPKRVHQVRKHMKKLRGLIRLIRPGFPAYRDENVAFRDAARLLSDLRDGDVLIATYDDVCAQFGDSIDRRRYAGIRRVLTWRSKGRWASDDVRTRLAEFGDRVAAARARIPMWDIRAEGFDTLAGGIRKSYRRARRAMAVAREAPTEPNMHEWRKRVKYHWYHARLLKPVAPEVMRPHIALAERLSDGLGDIHDLFVFDEALDGIAARARSADIEGFRGLLRRRRADLEAEAFAMGPDLLTPTAKERTEQWRPLWDAWRAQPVLKAIA